MNEFDRWKVQQGYSKIKNPLAMSTIDLKEEQGIIPLLERAFQVEASDIHLKNNSQAMIRRQGRLEVFSDELLTPEILKFFALQLLGKERYEKYNEQGEIDFTMVGRHRRILFEDVIKYKNEMKQKQKKHIIDIMNFDDEIGLYDS